MPEKKRHQIGNAFLVSAIVFIVCFFIYYMTMQRSVSHLFQAKNQVSAISLVPVQVPEGWLCVNDAEIEDLTELKGIGETIAANLVNERKENGMFFYPEDLLTVKGIGPVKLEQIRDKLNFCSSNIEENGE